MQGTGIDLQKNMMLFGSADQSLVVDGEAPVVRVAPGTERYGCGTSAW